MGRPSPKELVRDSIWRLELYSSNRKPVPLDLSDNTNQEGIPPSAQRALGDAEVHARAARYPSHYANDLKRALSEYLSIDADTIMTGCGSDDVLYSAIAAFAQPGDVLAYSDPTFAMIPYFAQAHDLVARPVPLLGEDRGWDLDVDRLLAADAKITYVCTPNNPTGTLASPEAMNELLAKAKGLVLVDEAYVDYSGDSLVKRAKDDGRLLVVRTMSKAFGLAGLRIGYAVGSPDLVRQVEKTRGPYKVSALAEAAAVAALDHDRGWVRRGIDDVIASKEKFVAFLRGRGHQPFPSSSNFVLVRVADAAATTATLRERGVAVRPFPALPGIGEAVRISVAAWPKMEKFLSAFEEVFPCV